MIYRTYSFKARETPDKWEFYDRDAQTLDCIFFNYDDLAYASGGAVASYSIDEDYLVDNNSTVNIVKKTDAAAGQIIALIDDDGTYYLGVINSVDNEKLQITYKQMTSLFDADVLNPTRYKPTVEVPTGEYDGDGNEITEEEEADITYLYDIVLDTAKFLAVYYCNENTDKYFRVPFQFNAEPTNETIAGIWDYEDDTLNLSDWIDDLFTKYNVILYFDLVFETTRAYIRVDIEQKSGDAQSFVKGNIRGMTIEHNEDSAASVTVCSVLDGTDKKLLSTWYLLGDNSVTEDADADNRVQPYRLTTATLERPVDDGGNEGTITKGSDGLYVGKDGATDKSVAESELLYNDFNHYVNVTLYRNSRMYPRDLQIGDTVRLILDMDENATDEEAQKDLDEGLPAYEEKTMLSIYTGRKLSSSSSEATLIFGKIRINYTDIMQMRVTKKIRT